jgi:hypothetical protein
MEDFHSDWLIGKWKIIEQGLTEDRIAPVEPEDFYYSKTLSVYEFRADGVLCLGSYDELSYFTKGNLLFPYRPSLTLTKEVIEKNFSNYTYAKFTFYGRDTLKTVLMGNIYTDMSPKAFKCKRVE